MAYTLYTNIKAKSISYSGSRTASHIKYIVIHYTANKTDKAVNNAKYYRDTNTRKAGAHYFVDDTSVYRSIDDLKIAYAVGGSKLSNCSTTGGGTKNGIVTNANSISIEMCSSKSKITNATKENAIALTKTLMDKYNISVENVVRHFDVTGKACPSSLYTGNWGANDTWIGTNPTQWNDFKAKLAGGTAPTLGSYVYQGVDYSKVFDYKFYSDSNPDLKAAFGYDDARLFNHFIINGMTDADRNGKLTRVGKTIATFNVEVYASHNPDLVATFGALSPSTAPKYYKHYCEFGYKEGRRAI